MAMLTKILRKLGLGPLAYRLAAGAASHRYKEGELPSAQQAIEMLHRVSPDEGGSCITEEERCVSPTEAALDIIIPAYNAQEHLEECVRSVLEQETSYSCRVLAIDDGSTDDTGRILDSFPGITVIHQENRGFSGARNRGLELASAGYIMFLDSDDRLCPGAIQRLMEAAEDSGAWIAEGAYREVDMKGKQLRLHSHAQGGMEMEQLSGYVWGKVYRREIFDGIKLPEGYWFEDSLMHQLLYSLAEKRGARAVGVSEPVLDYRQNLHGITRKSQTKPKGLDSLYITLSLHKDRQALGLETDAAYYDYILSMCSQTWRRTISQGEDVQAAVFALYADMLDREFASWHTSDAHLKLVEQALRQRDFGRYLLYCSLF